MSATTGPPNSDWSFELQRIEDANDPSLVPFRIPRNDLHGTSSFHLVRDRATREPLACAVTAVAKASNLAELLGRPPRNVEKTFCLLGVSAKPGAAARDLEALAVYAAARAHRLEGFELVVSVAPPAFAAPGFVPATESRVLVSDVNRMTHYAFAAMSPAMQRAAGRALMTDELAETIKKRAAAFYETEFFRAVSTRTLTRRQYIESAANNHQFVRWTTRLLGHAISMCADRPLRAHFASHLSEEVNHEVLIESDLRHLGLSDAELLYITEGMVPYVEIQEFMSAQESMAAFHRNPVWFLAVPFAIEAFTAFLDGSFITNLKECIAGWGVEHPSKGCTFLASHIHFDGGDDGHWEGTRAMFKDYLVSERDLQQALNICHLTWNSLNRAYTCYAVRTDV